MTKLAIRILLGASLALPVIFIPANHAASPASGSYSPAFWSGMRYRMVGPYRGGRVTAVAGVASDPLTYYMGSTGGGVWKTTDAGNSWKNISDKYFSVGSMGAIEVSLSNPKVVYAGTGSSKIRSNVSIGRGIYKSTDAGATWQFIGLRDTGQIATIRVHPTDPDIAYVASIGNPFTANRERGVYRTTDGGKNWKQVLFVSDTCGAADVEMQPGNPQVLFASMWHGQRKPWTIISGSDKEGGIYKSTDGGDTWNKLAGGLPNQIFGRSNVSISAGDPKRIYALIEAKPGSGVWRSDDEGATWKLVNGSGNLITRPFYYTTFAVDPKNPEWMWVGNEPWMKSEDGGKTFRNWPGPHSDYHEVWINPKDPRYIIQGNDGGAVVSIDGGRTWSSEMNQATAEIYQVALDNQYPYRIYGAQQDDTTLIVPSMPIGGDQDWRTGPGCETGPIIPDKDNPNIVYGGCKGQFSRLHMNTRNEERYWIGGQSLYGNGGAQLIYRFQRVAPMEVSPWTPTTVYYASQFVHRSRDGGRNWEKISPDLTAYKNFQGEPQEPSGKPITVDATGEEVYSVIYAIRESTVVKGLLWAGSNDGLVHVSRDDGKTWTNVTPKGLPTGGRVQNIEPSPHRPGAAYVAIYRFLLGDFEPYIYGTEDYGKTWTRLTDGKNGIPIDEPTRVVREDPSRANLLYAGTEMSMYISFDNGKRWQSFQMNLPHTPVTDIKFSKSKDLVLSTMGRSFWVLDNLTPLHQLSDQVAAAQNTLYQPRRAVRTAAVRGGGGEDAMPRIMPMPEYSLVGAEVDYYLASEPSSDITMEFIDAAGKVVRKFSSAAGAEEGGRGPRYPSLTKKAGMQRFVWDLRTVGPWQSATRPEGPNGPMVPPGSYQVRLTNGDWKATRTFTVIEDPRVAADRVTTLDLVEQYQHNLRVRTLVSDVNKMAARITAAQKKFKDSNDTASLAKVNQFASLIIEEPYRYSTPKLRVHITYLYGMTNSTDQKIGRDAVERLGTLRKEFEARKVEMDKILGPER